MDSNKQHNKPHRASVEPKSSKKKLHGNGQNVKAFSVNAPGKLQRQALRSSDVSYSMSKISFHSLTNKSLG